MVDVGANLGDQSIAAHLWDSGLQVLAIEPVPLTFLFLLLNLHLNALQRGQIGRRLAVPARHLSPLGPTSRARGSLLYTPGRSRVIIGMLGRVVLPSSYRQAALKSPHFISFSGRPDTHALVFGCAYCRSSPTARRRAAARCHREQKQPLR